MINSHTLVFSDFETSWYKKWAKLLKQDNKHLEGHSLLANKFWQNAIMAQALYERGSLKSGNSGIGFGVGTERLPALFASMGVDIMATDQDFTALKARHWKKHELAENANSLNKLKIATPQDFQKNVSFQPVDMTNITEDLYGKYDFLWSNCALGHLGSIPEGLKFITESTKCLKSGGFAVHTTEVNVLSNSKTVDSGDTVIFRPKDFYNLSKALNKLGCEMEPVLLDFGTSAEDHRIAMHPEFGNDYSKINFKGSLITQVVLIISKVSNSAIKPKKGEQLRQYINNLKAQRTYSGKKEFERNIKSLRSSKLKDVDVQPLVNEIKVSLGKRPKDIYLEFKNSSSKRIYSSHNKSNQYLPVTLSTSSPSDRESIFFAKNWLNEQANRPSSGLYERKNGKFVEAKFIEPSKDFSLKITLDPKDVKKGQYEEKFALVQEGHTHLPASEITVKVSVS